MPLKRTSMKPSQPKALTPIATTTSDLKNELLKWICERHATNGPLDRQLLRDKALELATSLGIAGFKCSEAWLTLFLKKHGFSPSLTNCSGPTFPDYRVWVDLLRSLITQYRHKDLFNVDELVMYADFLPAIDSPSSTETHKNRRGDSDKKTLESLFSLASHTKRIGVLTCCNSSGTEKLRPLVSGPYKLKDSRYNRHYVRNEASRIPDDHFGEWLAQLNEDMSKSERKILLLLSRERIRALQNVPQLSHVNLLFFPNDFPTQLRPLRGDVFHFMKMKYRSRYTEHVQTTDREWKPEEIVDEIVQTWYEVPQELIVSSFQRTKFREDESSLKIECPAWNILQTGISFKSFVTFDDDLSEHSSHIPDALKTLSDKKHQYNLRRSRRDTVDLDVGDDITLKKSRRGRKASKSNAYEETGSQQEAQSNQGQGSSGLKKKRRMTDEDNVEDIRDDQLESQSSRTSNSVNSTEETDDRSLVSRIAEFYDPNTDDELSMRNFAPEASSTDKNRENVNNLINDICQRSEKTGSLIECCLHTITVGNCVDKFADEDTQGLDSRFPERDSIAAIDSRSNETEQRRTPCTKRDGVELVENFPGEAGPSGKALNVSDETFVYKNPPIVTEFDDDDEEEQQIPIAGSLKKKILEAIECCGGIERSIGEDINLDQAGNDNNARTSKRTRECSDDNDDNDEPAEKRSRLDGSWSKRYETNFVFGPELHDSSGQSVESSVVDEQIREAVTKSKRTQTRSSELEKRCIFTLDGSSPSVSFPTTKD